MYQLGSKCATSARHVAGRRAYAVVVALLASVSCLSPATALAFKWHSCPEPPLPVYPSVLGAVSSPFIHPGYELRIVLNDAEVQSTGGFALDALANDVQITFASLFGAPVALAPRAVTAASESVLSLTFPDTEVEAGRLLTGPVDIVVSAGGRLVASIRGTELVALPPATDITKLMHGEVDDSWVRAALSADGDIWVPAAFHGDHMPMPGCEGSFVMPFAIGIGGAAVEGLATKFADAANPLKQIRGIVGYLGDMWINDVNFYGMYYPETIRLVRIADTLGVSVCRLNDAADLVLRIRGVQAWALPKASPFVAVAADAAPLTLRLLAARDRTFAKTPADSFENRCLLEYP